MQHKSNATSEEPTCTHKQDASNEGKVEAQVECLTFDMSGSQRRYRI
jgi:hypothetical protein